MRDQDIMARDSMLVKAMSAMEQQLRLALTAEMIQNKALLDLLKKKGLFTEEEFAASVNTVIQEVNSQAATQSSIITPGKQA